MAWPRRSAVVVAVLCSLLVFATPAVAQETPTTPTSARPRLTTTSVAPSEGGGGGGLSRGNKVVLLAVGLVVLALVLMVITWRYWRATTPSRAPALSEPLPAADPPPARKAPTV
jgi:hypothetical protein